MARNQLTLAIANDPEISAFGFESIGDAVEQYSFAAADGFVQCRFVSMGLQSIVDGVRDSDYVLVVTGINQLCARIGKFGDRPQNLRGWLLFSNSNYFLSEMDLTFGGRGGNTVYVDQYLCGANGYPALDETLWEFKDYFGELDEIVINGTTFVKAWLVVRSPGPYNTQNLLSIQAITWCGECPHTLADGTTLKNAGPIKKNKSVVIGGKFAQLYDRVGSPFVTNGKVLSEVLTNPTFCHALVKCHCGTTSWTVGDWSGYKSMCCGNVCKPSTIVVGEVKPGDVLVTSSKVATNGVKYYSGMVLDFVTKVDDVCLWRIVKVQSVDDFVASGNFDIEDHTYRLEEICSPFTSSELAKEFKLCYYTGVYTDAVRVAIINGDIDVNTTVCSVADDVLHKPWFVRELQDLLGSAWDIFVSAVKALAVKNSDLVLLMKSLTKATIKVAKGVIDFCADVPSVFVSCFEVLKSFVVTMFDLTVNTFTIAGVKVKAVGDYVLLDNAIIKFVSAKVKGVKQDGLKTISFAHTIVGDTLKVKSKRFEYSTANLVVVPDELVVTEGVTKSIGGRAFFYSGGCYRLMKDNETVLTTPTFKAQAPASVIFDCAKPKSFVDPNCSDIIELVGEVTKQLMRLNKPYRFYDVKVQADKCIVTETLNFRAPSYICDAEKFVKLCVEFVSDDRFDTFYVNAHAAVNLVQFEPVFEAFGCFKQVVECPDLLKDIDNGGIWYSFIETVSDALSFAKSIKVDFGLSGIVITATKRFKRFAGVLMNLYREFIASVTTVLMIGAKKFTYYTFEKPKILIAGVLHPVFVKQASDCSCAVEDGVGLVSMFACGDIEIQPTRVESHTVELEECDFTKPQKGGVLAVVNGYTFYNTGDYYYPSNDKFAISTCYKRGSGKSVQFSADVSVKEIEPVYKVYLDFEFDDDTITNVCKRVIGRKINFTGSDWGEFCQVVHTYMDAVNTQLDVPPYFIYDEEGGNDLTKPIMVSQWPIVEQQDVESTPAPEIVSDQIAVEEALSFIVDDGVAPVVSPFAFEFYDINGLRVLKQCNNNCWVATTLVQLQMLEVYDDPAFDLFKVGRVSSMVKKCYEATNNIVGAAGDTVHCMEVLLKDLHTMFITFDVECKCGKEQSQLSGCVFTFMPTPKPFVYGNCQWCKTPAMHTITSMKGTGVFCQQPKSIDINSLLLKPMCASVFLGNDSVCGHYKTNIYEKNVCVDGHGQGPILLDTLNTVCYKDVTYVKQDLKPEITPFLVYKNVEFYVGEIAKLVAIKHDFVVNAANENLSHGGGIAGALNKLTGGILQDVSSSYIRDNGKLKVATGVMLDCGLERIYNVVGPRAGKHAPELLRKAYNAILSQPGVPLTPLLSVGIFKVPIVESVMALLDVVGDNTVKCFCLNVKECDQIKQCVSTLGVMTPLEVPEQIVEVSAKVESETVVAVPKPFRCEGKFEFYDSSIAELLALQLDRFVFFTDSTFTFCSVAKSLDAHYDGALTTCVQGYLATTPTVPAGNVITFKCDNAVAVSFAVVPNVCEANYDKNVKRLFVKLAKIKGCIMATIPSTPLLKSLLKCCAFRFAVCTETKPFVSECFEAKVMELKVTHDGRDVHTVKVDTNVVIDKQLGTCSVDNFDLTGVKPNDSIDTIVSVAPDADWRTFYGFPRADVFHTLDHGAYAFENSEVEGKRVLKLSDNNCWVNAVCLQLQFAKVIFKSEGLQAMWDDFLLGKVSKFIHWLYWYQNLDKGQPSDVEHLLNAISRYFVCGGSLTITKASSCCVVKKVFNSPVVEASILRAGAPDGFCKHGDTFVSRVTAVKGTVIVTQAGEPKVHLKHELLGGGSYTAYTGSVSDGHYTVFESKDCRIYDGDKVSTGNDLSTMPVSSLVITNKVFDGESFSTKQKPIEVLNETADKFFSFGDLLMRNGAAVFVWFVSICTLLFKAFKQKDVKVIAQAPHRTGLILSRSLKYNVKELRKLLHVKSKWVIVLFKVLLILATVYATVFMFIRFSPAHDSVCSGYVEGYGKSNFDKSTYCNNVACRICLYGYQELSDFPHTTVVWTHLKDPLLKTILPLMYMAFLLIFGGVVVRSLMLYFVAQYVNQLGVMLGLQDNVWVLQMVPFSVFGDEIVVLFLVTKLLLFFKHVLLGCDKPSCVACSKSARLTRVPMQTIVNGSNRSFYVVANGGKSFCSKHKFFCVNCDSYGPGCTFINDFVAIELSNVVKTNVIPTSTATIDVSRVEFSDGFYYLYGPDGSTFWRYNFDITESKYGCKEVLKNCNVLTDFIVYNNSGSNVTQVRNACVYFSQLLCKPIKLVDSSLLSTLNVDFNGALHSAFVDVLTESFGKDLSNCTTMADCKTVLDLDVDDEDFVNGVSNAHKFNVLITDLSYNNFLTTYAKPEEKLATHDLASCMRSGAKVVNHNILVKENTPIVWFAKDFNMLSDEGRKYVVKTAKLKGVNFMLSFNDNRMQTSIPIVSVTTKCGSGIKHCYNCLWWLCVFVLTVFVLLGCLDYTTTIQSDSDFGFKYIEGGKLFNFETPLKCVHNTFSNFDDWHNSKFGFVPIKDRSCPIIVGVSNLARTIPGVPAGVFLYGRTLIFAIQAVFGGSNTCYDFTGPAPSERCLFNSACTVLNGLGGLRTYCYKDGLIEGASLYRDLQPNSYYSLPHGGYIRLPEVLASGFGFRTVRTLQTTYCRMGECIDSKEGVCFGYNRFLVYNTDSGPDFVCGTGFLSLLYNVLTMFSSTFSVMAVSGQILFNTILTGLIIAACLLFTKLKRMFGDLSYGVCTVIAVALLNNLSYIITQNAITMVAYAVLYFLCTRSYKYAWIWHLGYVVAYAMMAPWWLLFWYVTAALVGLIPSLLKLKVTTQLFDGDKFVGNFESAASGTFVLDMHSYQRLVNSVTPEKLKQHASSYNKYKYYSGAASEADYKLACYSHLAKAMLDYASDHQDKLYTPPTISYNSTLQAGLRKMAQPSGIVERCVVRVCYGSMSLNGLWLGDTVICPRHVIASNTNAVIDYDYENSVMRLHNFSVSVGNVFLGVVSVSMKGANLHIKVNQSNVNTPEHSFKTLKAGDSFNILACYDGVPSGVYGVTMRTNGVIRGSFITGACGSPGYNVNKGKVEFCYLHQLELGSGCHVGSNLEGVMYGGFEDQPTFQIEGANQLVTINVLAFLYGALLNGINWWLTSDKVSVDTFNSWATANGFTQCGSLDCFNMLAAKTGVDVQRLLAAVQRLHVSFGGKNILGFTTLTDEFTIGEVIKQMYGVTLQSTKVVGTFCNLAIVGAFVVMFWSELLQYTPLFWVSPGFLTPIFFILLLLSFFLMCMLKHKILFLYTFLIPAVIIMSCFNFAVDWYVIHKVQQSFDFNIAIFSLDIQSFLNVCVCVYVALLHTLRFYKANNSAMTYVFSICFTLYGLIAGTDPLSMIMTLLFNFTNTWYVGAIVYKCAIYLYVYTALPIIVGEIKAIMLCYIALGYLCCVYYGFLYWINRFFTLSVGVYDFKVSANEFKYMVANGLQAPRGVFDSLVLSIKLIGIGGEKTIKVSSVQSKLTDIKCTNVVLLGCLSSMNIASHTKEWAYCVDLHNKINLCDDTDTAQELLLALLAFFLSKQKDFGCDDLIESYFDNNTILQSVASTFVNMPSFISYENARQVYEEAVNNGSSPQLVKQLRRAMNIAKAEFDHETSVQKKISRMAEQAAAAMYKEARAVNRKSKVIGAMHALLFSMLRKLDMSSVDTVLNLAKDGVVPLSIIPAACSTKLNVVSADLDSYKKIFADGCVHYAGVVWNVIDIRDNDGKIVHAKEITQENVETLAWPLFLNCERIVKLQNNEIMPGKLKQKAVRAEGNGVSVDGKALYNSESGKTFMYAFIADKPDLKFVKWEFDGGCNVIELEPPCRFAVETPNGPAIKYLYFVKNLNTLRRGAVLGFIGATVRLQAGKQTEMAVNSPLLTMCAFSVDPAKTYVDAVKRGAKPVGNCIKMLSNGSGSGQAITNGVEANTNQDSYGGSSVCLYCRAHVEHPSMDGHCRLKGKYVQVPSGTIDPIRFCIENETCKVCMCWLNNGCACDRVSTVQAFDNGYLNEQGALVQLN